MFGVEDLAIVGLLVFLEGILSIDNALVLAILAKPLAPALRRKALTYGLVGAVVFRLLAVGSAQYLMRWQWVKFVGGGYLVWMAIHHLWQPSAGKKEASTRDSLSFWRIVLLIELTDIAFAVDSILAAVALSPKFWVVFTGGILGVVLMRFAAGAFVKILERFPRFETAAYLLVLIIGLKLVLDGFHLPGVDFHSPKSPAFWVFWGLMLCSIALGFRKRSFPKR